MAVNEESVPPVTVMSPTAKSVDASDSVKVMVSVWPDLSVPDPVRASVTVGEVVSTLCADWVATALWVIVAVLPGISVMVPEFSASAFKEIANPSVSVSPETTVYVNTSVFVPEPDE